MDVYDRLHSRQPINEIISIIKNENIELDPQEFLTQLSLILDRNQYYGKQLLKQLIDYYESVGSALVEIIYEPYILLLDVKAPDPQATDVVQYKFGPHKVLVEETPSLICAQGTTGFRTWEAALYLCYHMITHLGTYNRNETLVELGCGTGIVSILYRLISSKSKITVTDGDSNLLEQVSKNFKLNNLDLGERSFLQRLRWNEDSVPENTQLVLGADITYDTSVIPDLVACLSQFKGSSAYISCTERNLDTLGVFEVALTQANIHFEIISTISPCSFKQIFGRDISTSIRIYRLTI